MNGSSRFRAIGQRGMPFVAIAAFGIIGTWLLLQTKAAVPYASLETESGTTANGAAQYANAQASGGNAVEFASAAGSTGDPCTQFPALPAAKPTAANTGVPAGTTLTTSGDITASTAGQIIDGKQVNGTITVTANNVTIQNSKINMSGYWAIRIMDGVTGTKVLHNELYSANGAYTGIGTGDGQATICGNYIHHFENAITVVGPAYVQANFIEKLASDSPTAHFDGLEVYAGSNVYVWGNNITLTDPTNNWMNETGAINVTATWSNINSVDINGNWLGGGSYTLYVDEQGGYNVTNAKITGNTWYGASPAGHAAYGPALIRDAGSVSTWTGNVWENGTTLSN